MRMVGLVVVDDILVLVLALRGSFAGDGLVGFIWVSLGRWRLNVCVCL